MNVTTRLRSPSEELANIHVSPDFLPNRDPSGSVLIICSMALPTSPVPPVTSTTLLDILSAYGDQHCTSSSERATYELLARCKDERDVMNVRPAPG